MFWHQLIQYLFIQLFCFYYEEKVGPDRTCDGTGEQGMTTENKFGQILEVITPGQVYLMDKTFVSSK